MDITIKVKNGVPVISVINVNNDDTSLFKNKYDELVYELRQFFAEMDRGFVFEVKDIRYAKSFYKQKERVYNLIKEKK